MMCWMLKPVSDLSVAQWLIESMKTFGMNVASVIPGVFDAYARVFHPARKGDGDWEPVRWVDIARANEKVPHREMRFTSLVPADCFDDRGLNWRKGQEGLWDWPPEEGEIPEDLAAELARALTPHTATPRHCYFAYWDGWNIGVPVPPPPRPQIGSTELDRLYRAYRAGDIYAGTPWASRAETVMLSLPGRDYLLFEGPVDEVVTHWDGSSGKLPSLWWPADHAWCVATEIDFDSTYVGGSPACIEAILAAEGIEALRTRGGARLA